MTFSEDPKSAPDKSPEIKGPPSIALGILMLVLMGPIVVSLVVAIVVGSITSPSSLLLASGFIFVGTAVIGHFFFGHLFTWILPALVICMGIMGITAGIYGRDLTVFLFGGMLFVVGVAWKVPGHATHPIARWIIEIRTALLGSSNDRNK
jgi:hypothetical protein